MAKNKGKRRRRQSGPIGGQGADPVALQTKPDPKAELARLKAAMEAEQKAIKTFLEDSKNESVKDLQETLAEYGENDIREHYANTPDIVRKGLELNYPGEAEGIVLKIKTREELKDKVVIQAFFSIDPSIDPSDHGGVTNDLVTAISKVQGNGLDSEKVFSFTVEIGKAAQQTKKIEDYIAALSDEEKAGAQKLLDKVDLTQLTPQAIEQAIKVRKIQLSRPRGQHGKRDLSTKLKSGPYQGDVVFLTDSKDEKAGSYEVVFTGFRVSRAGDNIIDASIVTPEDNELIARTTSAEFPLVEIAAIRAWLVSLLEMDPASRPADINDKKLTNLVKAYNRLGRILELPSELALDKDINQKPERLYISPEELTKRETIAKAEAVLEIFCRHNWFLDPDSLQKNHLTFGDDGHLVTESIIRKNDKSTVKYRIVKEDSSGGTVSHPDFPDELTITVEPEVKLNPSERKRIKEDVEQFQKEINIIAQERIIAGYKDEVVAGRTLDIGDIVLFNLGPKDGMSAQIIEQGENSGVVRLGYELVLHNHEEAQGQHAKLNELQEMANQAWFKIDVFSKVMRGEVVIQPQEVYDLATELEGEIQLDDRDIEAILKLYNLNFENSNIASKRDKEIVAKKGQGTPGLTIWDKSDWLNNRKPKLNRKHEVVVSRTGKNKVFVRAVSGADSRVRGEILAVIDLKEIMLKIASVRHQLGHEAGTERFRLADHIEKDIKVFNEVIDLLELGEKYKLPTEVTTLRDGKTAAQEAKEARQEFDERDEVLLPVSYNREGKLTAKDPAGRNVYIDSIVLPTGDYFTPGPQAWTPVLDQYPVRIKKVNKDKSGKIKSYGSSLFLNDAEAALNEFRAGGPKLSREQQTRRQELDVLIAADFEEDPEAEKRMEVARLLETYEAVITNLVNTLNTITPGEMAALEEDDIIEGVVGHKGTGIIGKLIEEKKEKDGTLFTLELQYSRTDSELENYLGTAEKLFSRLNDLGAIDLVSQLRFTFKVKDGKVVGHSAKDLEQLLGEKKVLPKKSLGQSWVDAYDSAGSYADKNSVLMNLKYRLEKWGQEIDELRNDYINSGSGDVQEIATKLRAKLADYNELKRVEQELMGRNVEQARIITLELATPKQRKSLLEARSPEEYERIFADIVRQTWLRWAYEAKQYDDEEVTLKSGRDLDSKGLELLVFAGFNPKEIKMEPVASGESKPGYFMFDTGYASGFEHRGDIDAAPKGAKVDYQKLSATLGISIREAKILYPDPQKSIAPDRTAICDHHGDDSPRDSSSTEILYQVLRTLKVIDGRTIRNALRRTEYISKGADKIDDQEAERIFERAIKFVSYADTFSHPKMADPGWYKESYKTLLGLYKAARLDFFDVLLYFFNNRDNQSADGTEPIPMSELHRYPTKDREKTIYESEKRRVKDPRFNPKKKPHRENNPIDAYNIVKNSVEESQRQMEELERKGLIVDTDYFGPANGMKLVIDLGGQNLRGAAQAAYGLRGAAFLSWRPLQRGTGKHREGFFISAPKGELGESNVLSSRSEVVRGQMAVLGEQRKPLTKEFLQEILKDLGVPEDQITKVIEQVPEIKEPEKTKAEIAIEQARKRVRERILPDLRKAHFIIFRVDPTRGDKYNQMLESFIDKIREKNPGLEEDDFEDLREEIAKL